jgi:hypothetical protein
MSRLLCLSITSLALVSGCGDDCGAMGALEFGLVASSDQVDLMYGDLVASANNDCPAADAPSGVISLTITGAQMGDTSQLITLCVPRPDLLATQALALGSDVKIIDLSGKDATCSYTFDATLPPSGTAAGQHECNNGTNKAGFALLVNGALSLRRTCGTTVDTTPVTLRGTVAVKAM